jgi:Major Facilitator Superfamily
VLAQVDSRLCQFGLSYRHQIFHLESRRAGRLIPESEGTPMSSASLEPVIRGRLMLASFLTLVASGVGFATRAAMAGPWEGAFNIGSEDFGRIMGAGFLGFGMMIFFGGIITEKLGYRFVLLVAFLLHLLSAVALFGARPLYASLQASSPETATSGVVNLIFWSCFAFSIAQGLYEAVINPMIAQLYPENQTHFLNILHAGWPAGMIIGGLIAWATIGANSLFPVTMWEIPLTSFALFVLLYAWLAFPVTFPPTVANKSQDFLRLFSCFFSPVFLLLIVLHACIGYVELGVDSWVVKLLENVMPYSILVLVYTSFLMFILRFFAGPIAHKINPIGLLFVSSVIACGGLIWLGSDIKSVWVILAAATFYSFGKAFLWPTMLGVAGERYPQSGAVAMGALGAAGMLTVGLLAGQAIGYKQASNFSAELKRNAPETFARYASGEDKQFLGLPAYRPLEPDITNAANAVKLSDGKVDTSAFAKLRLGLDAQIASATDESARIKLEAKRDRIESELLPVLELDAPLIQQANLYGGRRALTLTAVVPAVMAVGYLILVLWFAAKGGYRKVELQE